MKKQSAQKAAAFFLYIRKVDELSMMVKPIMIFLHGGGVSRSDVAGANKNIQGSV
nr:hypothetical protein [Bacillus pumilus]